ncbi:transcriptional regulator, TetR family protein [Pedobacter sp. BAL39]|uniref:TetR/AcrR family transcriptional regulator n=1 Tax=Pedobacter sp. BAL39 TaxID=391596 RepID=UPI000155AB64|nr:TetR/AcrR family transcriptional regulator [Pedobacter sp. BAL39]EDM33899.1 transcriptional regulator, TetR family protein [Pedobacter sp. BAL39]
MKSVPKSESTRKFIIEATSGLFNKRGYAGTALSDLTEATQLSKGSIYGNFENKEAVALAVFQYNLSLIQQLINNRMSLYTSAKDQLMAHAQVYHSFEHTPFPDGGCPLLNTAVEADDTNEVLRASAAEGLENWKNRISALIERGKAAGEFKADTNARDSATTIIALLEGGMMMSKVSRSPEVMDVLVQAIKDFIIRMSHTSIE